MADVLTKAGVLLAIIVLAYALKRIGVFQTADYQILSKLVFRLSLPCAVITAFSEGFQRSGEMYLLALFGLGANVVLWGCCYLACRKRGESSCAFYTQSVAGYNIGAFTLPFIQSFLGSSGVVIACMFDMGNSVMCTGGNYALTSALMGKTEGNRVKSFLKRFFSSVPIDTYLVLVLLNLCGLSLPSPVLALAGRIGDANPFLSMFMIGLMLEFSFEPSHLKKTALVLLLRYGAAVIFSCLFYFLLPFSLEIRQILVVLSFAPISSLTPYFTERLGGETALSSFTASLTFVISIACITALILNMGIGV